MFKLQKPSNSNCFIMTFVIILFVSCAKNNNGHQYVDLGLSVMWATCNIGASASEEYGDYFAWGATEPFYKTGYAQENPQRHWKKGKELGYSCINAPFQTDKYADYGMATKWTKYLGDTLSTYMDKSATAEEAMKTELDPKEDAAHVLWGGDWRTPTHKEIDELLKYCVWIKTKLNGVDGYKVKSKVKGYTNNWIFLPLAGFRSETELYREGRGGLYCTRSLFVDQNKPYYEVILELDPSNKKRQIRRYKTLRFWGISIRPVCPKT